MKQTRESRLKVTRLEKKIKIIIKLDGYFKPIDRSTRYSMRELGDVKFKPKLIYFLGELNEGQFPRLWLRQESKVSTFIK